MFEQVSPSAYLWIRPLLVTVYILWGILWGMVAYQYGKASYVSWVTQGGSFRRMIGDIMDPFWWAIRTFWCRLPFIRTKSFCRVESVPSPYQPGHLLRFAIFLGSLSPFMFGLTLHHVDRSNWTSAALFISGFFVCTSILAAGGHLFLAFRSSPKQWERLVIGGIAWLILAPFVVYAIY